MIPEIKEEQAALVETKEAQPALAEVKEAPVLAEAAAQEEPAATAEAAIVLAETKTQPTEEAQ